MTRLLLAVFALALPVAAFAQDLLNDASPERGEMGNPVIGGPLGNNDPEDIVPVPLGAPAPLPSTPQQQDQLRELLVGKPVYGGGGGGRIGQVSDIIVGADQRVTNVVIQVDSALDPDRANVPVPWTWISSQLDAPTLVVPWNAALVAWLTEPGRSRRTVLQAAPSVAERQAYEQQAAAELDQWRDRIDTQARSVDRRDSGLRQLQLAYGAARDRWERLTQADPDGWGVEQGKLQADMDDLRETWTEVAEVSR
ncbi:MAG: PRC-barrel domain-containing protein [Rhodospirillaceae bacterium]|nr:PRC-barrel domain-containing protein [Rhodospirillales bacterium]